MDTGGHEQDRVRTGPSRTAIVLPLLGALLLVVLIGLTAQTGGEMPISGGPNLEHTASPPDQPPMSMPSGPPQGLPSGLPDGEQNPIIKMIAEVMVAILVIGGIALVVAIIALIVRALAGRKPPEGIDDAESDVVVNMVAVQEHLERSTAELDVEGEVNQAIVRCWQGLEEFAAAGGTERGAAQTAREYTLSVLQEAALPAAPLERLANLYEAALFSGDQLPESARAEAIACLTELRRTTEEVAHP